MKAPGPGVVVVAALALAASGAAGWLLLRPAPVADAPGIGALPNLPDGPAPTHLPVDPAAGEPEDGPEGEDDLPGDDRTPHGELDAEALYRALEAAVKAGKWLEFENLLRAHRGATDPRITALLVQGLQHPTFRNSIAELATLLGDPGLLARLLEAARDEKDPFTRAAALRAAVLVGRGEAMPAALAALESEPVGSILSNAAAGVLAELGNVEAARSLVELLRKHGNGPMSAALVHALGSMKDPEAIAEIGRLAREDGDAVLRLAAVQALGRTRDPSAAGDLLQVLRDAADPDMRREALRSLAMVGTEAALAEVVAIVTGGSPEDRVSAAVALQSVNRREAAAPLLRALEGATDDLVRSYILTGLGQTKNPAAAPALTKLAGDGEVSEGIRATAVRSLGQIADRSSTTPLLDLYDATPSSQRQLRAACITALREIKDPASKPRLERMLAAAPERSTEWILLRGAIDSLNGSPLSLAGPR